MKPSGKLILGCLGTLVISGFLVLSHVSRDQSGQQFGGKPGKALPIDNALVTRAAAPEGNLNEDDPIRSFADAIVTPVYPPRAIARKQTGVAVAMVHLDASRRVEQIDILDTPSDDIAIAMRAALLQWRFRSPVADPPGLNLAGKELTGTVTFYFFQSDGAYKVAGPKDAPNIREHDAGS